MKTEHRGVLPGRTLLFFFQSCIRKTFVTNEVTAVSK
jgi:hypothetical protein